MFDSQTDDRLYRAATELMIEGLVALGYSEADLDRCHAIAATCDRDTLDATQLMLDLDLGRYVVAYDDEPAQRALRARIEAGAHETC